MKHINWTFTFNIRHISRQNNVVTDVLFCIAVDGIFTTLNFDHHAIKKAQAKEAEIISLGQNLGTLKFKEIVQ